MYCPQCGAESQSNAKYCRVCGANYKAILKPDTPLPFAWPQRKKKTAAERREKHLTTGVVSLFSGVGLTIFLYFLSSVLVLKLPPEIVAKIPFEIEPVVRIIWLFGLLPTLTGVGHILAGLMVRPRPELELEEPVSPPRDLTEGASATPLASTSSVPGQANGQTPASVTERTTNLLEHNY